MLTEKLKMMTEPSIPTPTAPLNIINARLPTVPGLHQILICQGIIQAIEPITQLVSTDVEVIDVEGDWISLGGVDLQINGALGLAFTDLNSANFSRLQEICQLLWNQGVDGFLPTLVTTSVENIHRSLSILANFIHTSAHRLQPTPTANILGVHLEGPFINFDKRGAHPERYLLPLTLENVKRVCGDYLKIIKIITLAPELAPHSEVIPYLRSQGIIVSLGHSLVTELQAQQAFDLGATMVTHAFNAMPPLHHREPGLLAAAMLNPGVQCGLIADGQHVNPMMINLLLRASSDQQGVFLVSDALAPLGLPDGTYPWDTRQIEVKDGTAWIRLDYHTKLQNGILAGTALPLLMGIQNLVKWGICEVGRAIALGTEVPRRAIGLPGLSKGQPATQLLRWELKSSPRTLNWQRLFSCPLIS